MSHVFFQLHLPLFWGCRDHIKQLKSNITISESSQFCVCCKKIYLTCICVDFFFMFGGFLVGLGWVGGY